MSEKRFVLCKKGDKEYIEDNGVVQLYGFDVVCEMLNEQQSTIKHLTIEKHQTDKRFQTIIAELKKENEQLKEEIRAYPINEQYAEEIMQQNQKLRIEKNDLRIENEKLRKKIECCEYEHFLNELDEIHEKVDKGDLSDFNPLKEDKPLKDKLYYWQCKYYRRDYEHKTDMCTKCNYGGLLNYCLKDKCDKMVERDSEVTITEFENGVSIGWKKGVDGVDMR